MAAFRYALVIELGHPADPAVFVSEVLDWEVGDEFTASSLQAFRILEILPGIDEYAEFNAVWVVEPINGR
jgi:hypothetical protein